MTIKKITLSIFLLVSIPLFSQEIAESTGIAAIEIKLSYLDSIKQSFVQDEMATCVDSLWTKELTSLDLYNDITKDIETINTDEKVDYELPTELLKSRLEAMNAKSPFNIQYNQGLENIIKSFLKNRKRSFERLMSISEYYFPMFEEVFAKNNIPLEIKYLAIVESALNPKAVSRVGATGLWQFMYQTGKQYNLKIDSYIDERSDPLKATAAAAQYMSNMFTIFGDWELVLASYNSGPGNVAKAIRRSGGQQNFWSIKQNLPKETQGYVPAFLATMYLYEYRKEHGIKPNKAPLQHFATDTVMIKKQMSFKQIADLLDVPVSQLQLLNPSYKLNVIPHYHDENHYLRLPKNKMGVFVSNEEKIYAYIQHEADLKNNNPFKNTTATTAVATVEKPSYPSGSTTQYYKVKQGDNLSSIASKYNVDLNDLKKWNKLNSNAIAYGKVLTLFVPETKTAIATAETKEKPKREVKNDSLASKNNSMYIVQKGDNLSNIAEANDVSVAQIKDWNKLSGNTIQAGMSLQVNEKETEANEIAAATPAAELKNIEYTVQKGDNLGNISKKFGTSIADLKEWNHLADNNIALGKTLIVAKNEVAITTSKATAASFKKTKTEAAALQHDYFVKKGDSLFSIAKKYPGVTVSDIKKWNDISNEDIKPGMKLKIGG